MDALASDLSRVDVDQFYGIELGELPARIAGNRVVDDGPHHEQPAEP